MKAKKSILAVAAAAVLALTMTACGGTVTQSGMQFPAGSDNSTTDFVNEALQKCVEYPEDYKYTIYTADGGEECAEITEYFGNKTEIKIPNTYDGRPVRRIGEYAFTNNRKGFDVTCVVIQDNMKEISDYAFHTSNTSNYGSPSLQTIVIPGNVKKIGYCAFAGCPRLENVALGEGVEYIDDSAFSQCTSLKSLNLPDSLTYIDPSVVYSSAGYNQTSAIFTYRGNSYDSAVSSEMRRLADDVICGDSPLKIENDVVTYCRHDVTEVNVPEGTKGIADEAFAFRTKLTDITLPESLTSIGKDAFEKCTGLTEVKIPDNATCIDPYIFSECENIKVIYKGTKYNLSESSEEIQFNDEIVCGDSPIRIENDVVIYCRHDVTEVRFLTV